MKQIYFTLTAFLLLLLSACTPATSGETDEPTQTPGPGSEMADWLAGFTPETILLQHDYEPTFFFEHAMYPFGRIPFFTLYADGTLIYLEPGKSFEDQVVMAVQLSPEEVQALMESAINTGFASLESHTDMCFDSGDGNMECIADASFTILRMQLPETGLREVKIYAHFANQPETFEQLNEMMTTYSNPAAEPYIPTHGTLFVNSLSQTATPATFEWTLPISLADLNYTERMTAAFVLEGENLDAYLAAAGKNIGFATVEQDGKLFYIYFNPWLPGADFSPDVDMEFGGFSHTTPPPIDSSGNAPDYSARFSGCPVYETLPIQPLNLAYLMEGDVWVWNEGTEPISLTGSGDVSEVILTPNRDAIVFAQSAEGVSTTLWVSSLDQSELRSISGNAALTGEILFLSFSSDQAKLAFIHYLGDQSGELWVANLDGSGAKRLVSHEDLLTISIEPNAETALPTGVTWLPDTYVLTYDARPTFDGIYLFVQRQVWYVDAVSGAQSERFANGDGGRVSYSPDGTTMLLHTPESLRWMNIEEGVLHTTDFGYLEVGFGEFYMPPPLAWSFDSQSLLVAQPHSEDAMNQDGPVTVWEVPLDGSPASERITINGFFPSIQFSPGLDAISYWRPVSQGSNTRELHIAMLDGSQHAVFTTGGIHNFTWAADNQHFVYSDLNDGSTYIGDVCNETEPALLAIDFYPSDIRWLDFTRFLFERADEGQGIFEVYLGSWGGSAEIKLNLGNGGWYGLISP